MVLDGKSSQECPVNDGVPQGSILGPTLFLLYINGLPDDVICNIAIYDDDTTLHSNCDQTSDLLQQIELASKFSASKKIGALIRPMKFLSPEVAMFLYKSNIWPWMEHCCHVWIGAPSWHLEFSDKLQKQVCRTVRPSFAASLEPLTHC